MLSIFLPAPPRPQSGACNTDARGVDPRGAHNPDPILDLCAVEDLTG